MNLPKISILTSCFDVRRHLNNHIYCLDRNQRVSSQPMSIFVRKSLNITFRSNSMIRRIFESGIIKFWLRNSIENQSTKSEEDSYYMGVEQEIGMMTILVVGLSLSSFIFGVELVVNRFMNDDQLTGFRKDLFIFFDKLIDGQRHLYFVVENPLGRDHNFNLMALFHRIHRTHIDPY